MELAVDESAEVDRALRFQVWSRRVLGTLVLVSLGLGFYGYVDYLGLTRPLRFIDFFNVLYLDMQLFGFEFTNNTSVDIPWALQAARTIAPITTFFAVVAAASLVFGQRVGWYLARTLRLKFAIVIGATEEARAVARAKRATMSVHEIDQGDIISLRRAGIRRARTIYVCVDDRDDVAANVAIALRATARRSRPRLRINAQVTDPVLALGLKARRLMAEDGKGKVVEFFSMDEMAAQQYVIQDPIEATARAEILIAGAGVFGRSILVAFAKAWRASGRPPQSLLVTLVDPDATSIAAEMNDRWPVVAEFCQITPDERELTAVLRTSAIGAPYRSYICYENEDHALRTALSAVRLWHGGPGSVVVRISRLRLLGTSGELRDTLLDSVGSRLRFAVVPTLAGALVAQDPDPVRDLARAIHENYVAQERGNPGAKMGEGALVAWDVLHEDYKAANYGQADGFSNLLRLVGATIAPRSSAVEKFTILEEEVQRLAPLEHDRWVAERKNHGWVHGKQRDDRRKKHPAIAPWETLSDRDRQRDFNVVKGLETIVDPILADMGLQIVRLVG
jgi:hypothetical protein